MLWFSLAHTRYIGGTCAVPPWSQETSGSRTDLPSKSIIPVSVRPFMPRKDKSNRWPLNVVMTGPGRCRNAYRAAYWFYSKSGLMVSLVHLLL